MSEQAKVEVNEKQANADTAYKTASEEPKQQAREERRSWIPGWDATKETMGQFTGPWFDAASTTLEHVHDLQQKMFDRTHDAIHESFEFVAEGIRQANKVNNRTHQVMQEQLRRFGSR